MLIRKEKQFESICTGTVCHPVYAIKCAQNYIDCQDTDGEKRAAFLSAANEDTDDHDEVKALGAKLKDRDQQIEIQTVHMYI